MLAPVAVSLPFRPPLELGWLLRFYGQRAVPGVESVGADGAYRRSVWLTHGAGIVEILGAEDARVSVELVLEDERDGDEAVTLCRRMLDLDADPAAIASVLTADRLLGPLVRAAPGRRVPGAAAGAELAVRAVLGQQVSVAGARTLAGRLVQAVGTPLRDPPPGGPTHLFPTAAAVAAAPDEALAMPASRRDALRGLCAQLAAGAIELRPAVDAQSTRRQLLALKGIGPWTAEYISMRALGDRDVALAGDLGVRHAIKALGGPHEPREVAKLAERWRPYRSYAVQHLWASLYIPHAPSR